jgi:hypothetical protein
VTRSPLPEAMLSPETSCAVDVQRLSQETADVSRCLRRHKIVISERKPVKWKSSFFRFTVSFCQSTLDLSTHLLYDSPFLRRGGLRVLLGCCSAFTQS